MLSTVQTKLHERALAAAGRYRSAHAELLSLIMEVDEARLSAAFGLSSTYLYCREKLGLTEDVACSFISVARKARKIPELKAAVDAGLDFTKAKQVSRVITPENQNELLKVAKASSCKQLERAIVKDHPRAAVVESVRIVAEDRHKLELGLSQALLEKFRRAQTLECNKQSKAASLEDTLAALLELYLRKEDPVQKAQRAPQPRKPSSLAAEQIPAASRHAVNERDEGRCQIPACESERWIDIHHIKARCAGGTHAPENLITLCGFHHREHHRNHPPRGGSALRKEAHLFVSTG
ncbi:MAG: HNH endonuclease [Proteobacteria bacterium]|nr:MAG: HNH endonuclease [Pseudomonadota bacterium]